MRNDNNVCFTENTGGVERKQKKFLALFKKYLRKKETQLVTFKMLLSTEREKIIITLKC